MKALPATIVPRLVEESLDAVLVIDENCTIRYLNQSMQALSGYARAELLGQSLNLLLPAAVGAHHDEYVRRYLASHRPSPVLGRVREFAIRHRSGAMIPIELKALDLGTCDGKRYFGAFLVDVRRRREMEDRNAVLMSRLEHEALTDPLTGLPNRRAFCAEGGQLMARAARSGGPLALGVADIDFFKAINDRYGHPAGDVVLQRVSDAVRTAARTSDFVGRVGGEEFGLLFPNTTLEQAHEVAERIRLAVDATRVALDDGGRIGVSVSIGLAPVAPAGTLDDALAASDAALYRAKNGGRNRTEP